MTDAASTMKISKPSITLKNRINHFSCIAHIVHHIDHFLIENYDYTPPGSFIGKVGKQLREFDDRIGLMMNALESLGISDNTSETMVQRVPDSPIKIMLVMSDSVLSVVKKPQSTKAVIASHSLSGGQRVSTTHSGDQTMICQFPNSIFLPLLPK